MAIETARWEAADHLGSIEAMVGYLEAVLEDGDPALLAAALDDIARAKGLAAAIQARAHDQELRSRHGPAL